MIMLEIIKQEIKIKSELKTKIEWACKILNNNTINIFFPSLDFFTLFFI